MSSKVQWFYTLDTEIRVQRVVPYSKKYDDTPWGSNVTFFNISRAVVTE